MAHRSATSTQPPSLQVAGQDTLRQVGSRAAAIGDRLVQDRVNDGFNTTLPEQRGSTDAGKWRPTPPEFKAGKETQVPTEKTWVVGDVKRFRMPPPPALDSEQYRESYYQST